MSRGRMVFIVSFVVLGCADKGRVKGQHQVEETVKAPPKISALTDLGGLPVLSSGALNDALSDGRFTPGEWVVVGGEHLSGDNTAVRIGETVTPIAAQLETGLLVRMPRDLVPFGTTTLTVTTPFGSDSISFRPQAYLVASDTSANQLRFFRTVSAPEKAPAFEPECEAVSLERVRLHARSGSGALLYATAGAKDTDAHEPQARALMIVHMGAPDHPAVIGQALFSSVDGPIEMAVTGDGSYLVLLTQTELFVFDIIDEAAPKQIASLNLAHDGISEGGYLGMALLRGGEAAVLLDGLANRLSVVDLEQKRDPKLVSHLEVLEDEMPRTVDLVTDRSDDTVVHVVTGANLRLAKNMFHRFAPKLLSHLKSGDEGTSSRLLSYRLVGDRLSAVREIALPSRTVPLFVSSDKDGGLFVSAADFNITTISADDSVMGGLRMAVGVLADAVKLGSIFHIDRDGNISKYAEGMSLFLTMTKAFGDSSNSALVLRVIVKKFPPSIGVKLSVDTLDSSGKRVSEQPLRELSWSFLIPPYTTPDISF